MPLDITQAYQQLLSSEDLPNPIPNPMQQAVWNKMHPSPNWGVSLLLKGPTGSGKTEAVSVPALAFDGDQKRRLIMVYPTRSLVDDQIMRFEAMLERWSKHTQQPLTLVVDTGAQSIRHRWQNGDKTAITGNPRRHLYQGDVIITTLDKFLFRFFGFGEPNKSYTYPLRIRYGAKKTLVCFDEAHAYDDVAFTNFNRLVKTLFEKGLDVVLMTATMPQSFAEKFDYLDEVNYVEGSNYQQLEQFLREKFSERKHPEKQLIYIPSTIEDPTMEPALDSEPEVEENDPGLVTLGDDETTETTTPTPFITDIIEQVDQKYSSEKRLIVTVEKVTDAVYLYKHFRDEKQWQPLLYHGRLTGEKRAEVYKNLKDCEKKGQGYLLVSTSAIEVGCDLDAHILITQLCDPDRLIQRAGRCNRKHSIDGAKVIVVGDTIPIWLTSLTDGLEKYISTLNQQHGQPLNVQELITCIQKVAEIDYHVEMMFEMLYEYVYEAKLENKPLHEKGLLFTRSWEPTITLCTGENQKGKLENAIEVPISRCKGQYGASVSINFGLQKRRYDTFTHKMRLDPVGKWECAYTTDLIAAPENNLIDDKKLAEIKELGYVALPELFNVYYQSGYRQILEVKKNDNVESKVWFYNRLESKVFQDVIDRDEEDEE